MKQETKAIPVCSNEGCGRAAQEGDSFCETCALEWTLYRRDTRSGVEPDATEGHARLG